MANYSINLTDGGSGTYTATCFRAPTTAASGGTALLGGGSDLLSACVFELHAVFPHVMAVIKDDKAVNG